MISQTAINDSSMQTDRTTYIIVTQSAIMFRYFDDTLGKFDAYSMLWRVLKELFHSIYYEDILEMVLLHMIDLLMGVM